MVPVPTLGDGAMRDHWGFVIKKELEELYQRFAPVLADEEAERSERWAHYLRELQESVPGLQHGEEDEREAQLLQRALLHLAAIASTGEPPAQAAPLLQRLSSLVQAGLPMSKRGAFWRLFLNIDTKRRVGEYQRLVREVGAIEAACLASAAGGVDATGRGLAKAAMGGAAEQHPPCSIFSLVADASSGAVPAESQYRQKHQQHHFHHRVDVFSLTVLEDCDESPRCTPTKAAGADNSSSGSTRHRSSLGPAVVAEMATPPTLPPALQQQLQAADELPPLATPASMLQTPQACSTASTSGEDSADGGGGGDCVADSVARWRQQDYLSQIDKDLHRTFPNHPVMDTGGRAALRRILSAYARRNASVGYCQGLNFLGATFLLLLPEEDSFWCLAALVEDVLGTAYFDERMAAPQVDVLVYGHLLQGRFPSLWRHLAALEVDAASVTMHWFLLGFLNSLPLDSTLRVWDLLFFEGSPVVLFRVALALVEIYEQALMCTRESSDAYMLLQCCAQMTFDGSRLVDTACIGFSHLRASGLEALRQRHRPAVMENLRSSFSSEDDYGRYLDSPQASPSSSPVGSAGGGDDISSSSAAAPPSFATTFQRLNSAVLAAEEAAQRMAAAANSPADGGHLSGRSGSSRRSSPGSMGNQPTSPLARMRQAVSGLTSRLMPSALPPLLPAGAVDVRGHEQQPLCATASSAAAARRSSYPGSGSTAKEKGPVATAAPAGLHVRRISIRTRNDASPSPTSSLSHSAGSGAALGRRTDTAAHITPFSEVAVEVEGILAAEPLQESLAAWTPPQRRLASAASPGSCAGGSPWATAAAAFQSMPATPSELLVQLPPPTTIHRRALTEGDPSSRMGGHRQRRRLTIDLLNLAELRPNLAQPGIAAALAIAANPSPRGGPQAGGIGSAGRSHFSVPPVQPLGTAVGSSEGAAGIGYVSLGQSSILGGGSAGEELALPIRMLHFGDAEDGCGTEGDAEEASEPGIRRTATAPPAALLVPFDQRVAARSSCVRHPWRNNPEACSGSSKICSTLAPEAGTGGCDAAAEQAGDANNPGAQQPSPGHGGQQAPALSAVIAQLQEEVALTESRRHDAEVEAQQSQQMVTDLRGQLGKVQSQLAHKEALVAELEGQLEASTELGGVLMAQLMAAEAEAAQVERQRRQLAAMDALIRRLMDAVSATTGGCSASVASSSRGSGAASFWSASSYSPQSSGSATGSRQAPARGRPRMPPQGGSL